MERQQDVVTLDVAVDHVVLVQVFQPLQRFPRNRSDLSLRHDVARHDVRETATFHVLHDDPQVSLEQEGVDKVDDVLMARFLHDEDFVDDQVLLRLLLEVHLLDRDRQVRADLIRRVNSSRSTARDETQ